MKIAPSILNADQMNLKDEIAQAIQAGSDQFHLDIMDAHFVPNLSFGPALVHDFKQSFPQVSVDIHLMSNRPQVLVPAFVKAGADLIELHYESMPKEQLQHWLAYLKAHQVQAGLVLNPETPVTVIGDYLARVQQILLMTVHPGFGGQKFLPGAASRISQARAILTQRRAKATLAVDGGINQQTIATAKKAGADLFVVGSYIFSQGKIAGQIKKLERIIK